MQVLKGTMPSRIGEGSGITNPPAFSAWLSSISPNPLRWADTLASAGALGPTTQGIATSSLVSPLDGAAQPLWALASPALSQRSLDHQVGYFR